MGQNEQESEDYQQLRTHEKQGGGVSDQLHILPKLTCGDSIEAKLLELGWEKEDFPSEWDSKWRTLVKQPRELTPHSKSTLRLVIMHWIVEHCCSLEDSTSQTRSHP